MWNRLKQIRWIEIPCISPFELTEDENCAAWVCCPCYVAAEMSVLVVVPVLAGIAVMVVAPPFMIVSCGVSMVQWWVGREAGLIPWWEREAWIAPSPTQPPPAPTRPPPLENIESTIG